MLKLPSYQQLSREQDAINNLPLTGSYLVVGPPGTGKTVMAIYRAAMFQRMGRSSNLIVYNRPLMYYLEQATKEVEIEGIATTFHRWFYYWYLKNFHSKAPQKAPFIFDWVEIHTAIARSKCSFEQYDHLIVDEGQDFPRGFYLVMRLLTANITVFADENQRINDQNSTFRDIQNYLNIREIHRLARNYRNTRPIAKFARSFYAGLPSGIPDLPSKNGPRPRALQAPDLRAQVNFIARYERNNADKDIAVFVATNRQQYTIAEMLQKTGRTRNPVQLYVSSNRDLRALDFHRRGIKILTYASAKGLEFDTVFLPELEKRIPDPNSDLEKMRFYVLASRAREGLFLLYSGGELPPLLQRVPADLFDQEDI